MITTFDSLRPGTLFRFPSEKVSVIMVKRSARRYSEHGVTGLRSINPRADVIALREPRPAEVLDALRELAEWAIGPQKTGNPYQYPMVKNALVILSLAHGGQGDWSEGLTLARAAVGLDPID